jgi:folate-dependent phosphoribosylglycinamide formyltransferase PurN
VALLSSRRAPGLRQLLDDPARGELFELVVGVVTDPLGEAARELGQLAAVHNLAAFCRLKGGKLGDARLREQFDERTANLLHRFRPDLILLSGYLHVLSGPMLEAYPRRIVNLHDADLTIVGSDGVPRYRGLHSTYDAIRAGERETRTTAHVVTKELDQGPILFRSARFPVHPMVEDAIRWGATDLLKAYAYAQREWMMRSAWGPMLKHAIRLYTYETDRLPPRPSCRPAVPPSCPAF